MKRETKQRAAIRRAFEKHPARALSPREVLDEASSEVPILGIATVYRNIKTMVEEGELVAVLLPGEANRYQRLERRLPHILIDERADKVVTFGTADSEPAIRAIFPKGCTAERYQIIVFGTISDEE